MPSEEAHQAKANHNQAFLDTVEITRFPDWAGIVAFYKALHLVEMFFARSSIDSRRVHSRRNRILQQNYPELWRHYGPMYRFSLNARYRYTRYNPANVRRHIIEGALRGLERAISDASG